MKNSRFILLILLSFVMIWSCSVNNFYKSEGLKFFKSGQYDKAVVYFNNALKQNPDNSELKTLLLRTKMNALFHHLAIARNARKKEDKKLAEKEYQISISLFPDNLKLINEYNEYIKPKTIRKKNTFSSIKAPVLLKVDEKKKIELNFRNNLPIKQIFNALGKSFGINFIFEKSFRDFMYTYHVVDLNFYDVLEQLCLASSAKFRVMGEKSVLIYLDNRTNNQNFELKGIKLFLLKNRKAEKVKALVATAFRNDRILAQEDKEINGLIVTATHETLKKIDMFIQSLDRPVSKIEFDVQILEINKNVLNKIGADYVSLNNSALSIRPGSLQETSNGTTTTSSINSDVKANELGKTTFFLTLPSIALDLMHNDNDSKIIARPNLHGINNEKIDFSVGDSIPVPETTFNSMAGGGFSNIPTTNYKYKDVGIKLELTPFIHKNEAVTVIVKLKYDFITGYVEQFPLFGKRELECTIRMEQGETSIIGGFIRDEERGVLKGLPAISKLPILGRLFSSKEKTKNQTDIIFSITPKITHSIQAEETPSVIWQNSLTKATSVNVVDRPERRPGESIMRDGYRQVRNPEEKNNQSDAILISPVTRRAQVNQTVYYSIRLRTNKKLKTVSVSGVINGDSPVIEKLNTDFYSKKGNAQVFKNFSETSFDIGYTLGEKDNPTSMILGQISVKFANKGDYTINLSNVSATTNDGERLDLKTNEAKITIY